MFDPMASDAVTPEGALPRPVARSDATTIGVMSDRRLSLPERPWIVAHRGASEVLAENTLAAFERGVAEGCHMVELDLQMTLDEELVAVHDFEVEVGGRMVRPEGVEVGTLREEGPGPEAGRETPFPTLEEVLEALSEQVPLNLELKRETADPGRWADVLSETLGGRGNVLLSSFDWALLEEVRRAFPGTPVSPIGSRKPHDLLRAAERLDAWGVHCHRRLAFSDFVDAASASRWPVLVYTVNEAASARQLFERGVAGVFTDAPGRMLAELGLDS